MFSFADFYHRFAITGLTFDEIYQNWQKYNRNPRDMNDLSEVPKKLKEEIASVKPAALQLMKILNVACNIHEVEKSKVNSKNNKRELADVRQQVCYVALELGFTPADFPRILKWDRSLTYARAKKCMELANTVKLYRERLNELLCRFGIEEVRS